MRSRTEGVGEVRPQRRPLTGCEAPAAASGTQPACLCASAQALAIMENYGSGWPLQLSTGARAASRASTTWRAQREARAASGEPLWRELHTLGLAFAPKSPHEIIENYGSGQPLQAPARRDGPGWGPRIALCIPTGWAAGRVQLVVHKRMLTCTSNRNIDRRGTLWLSDLSLLPASRPR